MNLGFPVQERLTQNALTVAANCVNPTRKHAASVTAYSVLRACPSIQCSTPELHQQTTGNAGSEKELSKPPNCGSPVSGLQVLAVQHSIRQEGADARKLGF